MPKISLSALVCLCVFFLAASVSLPAHADEQSEIQKLENRLDAQQKLIENQQHMLDTQAEEVDQQKKQINALTKVGTKKRKAKVSEETGVAAQPTYEPAAAQPLPQPQPQNTATTSSSSMTPPAAPPQEEKARPQIDAIANQGGILSPKGMLTYENTIEYTNTTRNIFTFNGVELAQVVLVGGITANATANQIVQESGRLRLGLTNRLEADIHVPYVYRNENLSNTVTTTGSTETTAIEGSDLGDIDAGLAYQINNGEGGWPFLIGNLRYKANNADGPYDIPYNANNIATRLPTGTGFQTAEASITAIKVTDPAVLFGNIGYVYDVPRDIDRNFNGTYIGHVNPGDAVNALAGMSFAINQDTSFSLGYKHSYVFPTIQNTLVGGTNSAVSSGSFQVGSLLLGLSYAVSPKTTVNFNVEAGVTNDAPDVHLILRIPFQLGNVF
ncbi:MAG: transporter [Alphaproteobacteria bacterium]|nr:transporter [Alphaproteobacteria bacterium]